VTSAALKARFKSRRNLARRVLSYRDTPFMASYTLGAILCGLSISFWSISILTLVNLSRIDWTKGLGEVGLGDRSYAGNQVILVRRVLLGVSYLP
jgi:hypothetical protein